MKQRWPRRPIEEAATLEQRNAIAARLETLSLTQLQQLAQRLGLDFVSSTPPPAKDDYVNLLEEADWDDFEHEYRRVVRTRG